MELDRLEERRTGEEDQPMEVSNEGAATTRIQEEVGEVKAPREEEVCEEVNGVFQSPAKEKTGGNLGKHLKEKGKENIPPKAKGTDSPSGKDTMRKGSGKEKESEEEPSTALIPYGSPPPPKISDFLVEALEAREGDNQNAFQVVKRKSKRFPLTTGMREEPRVKGKVQKLCLEWDAKGSQ